MQIATLFTHCKLPPTFCPSSSNGIFTRMDTIIALEMKMVKALTYYTHISHARYDEDEMIVAIKI